MVMMSQRYRQRRLRVAIIMAMILMVISSFFPAGQVFAGDAEIDADVCSWKLGANADMVNHWDESMQVIRLSDEVKTEFMTPREACKESIGVANSGEPLQGYCASKYGQGGGYYRQSNNEYLSDDADEANPGSWRIVRAWNETFGMSMSILGVWTNPLYMGCEHGIYHGNFLDHSANNRFFVIGNCQPSIGVVESEIGTVLSTNYDCGSRFNTPRTTATFWPSGQPFGYGQPNGWRYCNVTTDVKKDDVSCNPVGPVTDPGSASGGALSRNQMCAQNGGGFGWIFCPASDFMSSTIDWIMGSVIESLEWRLVL